MADLPPPPDGDQNRGSALLAVFWTPFPITVMLISVRLYVRISMKNLSLDDYLMFVAWITYSAGIVVSTIYVSNGGARHIYYLKPDEIVTALKYNMMSQPFGVMASAFGKASVAFLVLRLIGPTTMWRKRFLHANTMLYMLVSITSCITIFVQCTPPRALWAPIPGARCWKSSINANFATFQSVYGAFLDFILAFMPITIIWKVKLSLKKKLGLCILLGLGAIAGVCAAFRTKQASKVGSHKDYTWGTFGLFAWGSAEASLVIICGCIPTAKPLYDRLVRGKRIGPVSFQYPNSRCYELQTEYNQPGRTSVLNESGNSTNIFATTENTQWVKDDSQPHVGSKEINVEQSFVVDLHDRILESVPRGTKDHRVV